jgi:hypothetical protein
MRAPEDFGVVETRLFEAFAKGFGQLFGGQRDEPRLPAEALREGLVEVASGG